MKRDTLDTILVMLCMLTPVSPGIFAKKLVIISSALLLLRILSSRNIFYVLKKLLIILLFIPGVILAIFNSPDNLIRFVPILLMILGFPFYDFKVRARPIKILSFYIIIYFIVTQVLLALGNSSLLNFREVWYPNEYGYVWNYGFVDSIVSSLGQFRAGGLYYNPNVLASVIVLYYFIFSASSQYTEQSSINFSKKKINTRKIINIFMLVLVSFSLFFTGSRTAMVALIWYIGVQNFNTALFKKLQIKKNTLWAGLFCLIFLFLIFDRILEGASTGSLHIKFTILMNYLSESNSLKLLFGGTYNKHFDTEYGNWIGAYGFLGLLAWFITLRMIYCTIPLTKPLIVAILLSAMGNTVLYGLLTGSIMLAVVLISSSYWRQIQEEEEKNKKPL